MRSLLSLGLTRMYRPNNTKKISLFGYSAIFTEPRRFPSPFYVGFGFAG
jgi:hypothetical protein